MEAQGAADSLTLDQTMLQEPEFETIGAANQSTLAITLPASVAVHVRRGSVMATFPSTAVSTKSMPSLTGYLGGLSFQKMMSTEPVRVLISVHAMGEPVKNRSFVTIALDGTKDWVLLDPRAVQAYTGNDVELVQGRFGNGWFAQKYVLVKGRGLCGLVGEGDVFKVTLTKDETLQVRVGDLLATSTRDVEEFGTLEKSVWKNGFRAPTTAPVVEVEALEEGSSSIEQALHYAKRGLNGALKVFHGTCERVSNYVFGNGEYYTLRGPRTVLIQSGSATIGVGSSVLDQLQNRQDVATAEKFVQREQDFTKPRGSVRDNLGVVRLVNGEVEGYKNVENFGEEVERIEKAGGKRQ